MAVDPERVARHFVNLIDRHDVAGMTSLMAPWIRFVDSRGGESSSGPGRAAYWASLPFVVSTGVVAVALYA